MSNYEILDIGAIGAWGDYTGAAPGKRFVEKDLAAQFLGMSANSLAPGGEAPFWHTHTRLEELYVFLGGTGQFALDDEVVSVHAGTVVRVGAGVWRAWRAAPSSAEPLTWLCLRAGGDTLEAIGRDGEIARDRPFPWA
ncbi:cupin domain-containing protein [Microbacterium sp. No. 7]|uniref:cupin domain-containing protein n=1 Tax=Microbacterium sp. No. 7 TaxID=1714373 RepID=UPI0006CF4B48|nr:cupin domain-containing protein [Microbacterium sp. No. 7]ALJ18674.1 hypothetical protein AOA12_01590 [Microbacterium sp. No. 7]